MNEREAALKEITDRHDLQELRDLEAVERAERERRQGLKRAEARRQQEEEQRKEEDAENLLSDSGELHDRLKADFPKYSENPEFVRRVVIEASGDNPNDYRSFHDAAERVLQRKELAGKDPAIRKAYENEDARDVIRFGRELEIAEEIVEGRRLEGSLDSEQIFGAFKEKLTDDPALIEQTARVVDEMGSKGADLTQFDTYVDAFETVSRKSAFEEIKASRR